jgi:hypothetical protein
MTLLVLLGLWIQHRTLDVIFQDRDIEEMEKSLSKLRSSDTKEQQKALETIESTRVTPKIGARLIRAAAETYPNEGNYIKINKSLLRLLWDSGHPSFLPVLEETYDKLEGKSEARESALRILTEMQSADSLALLAKLLKRPSSRSVDFSTLFVPIKPSTEIAKRLFPDLLDALGNVEHRASLYQLVLDFVEKGLLELNKQPAFRKDVLERMTGLWAEHTKSIDHHAAVLDQTDLLEKGKSLPEGLGRTFEEIEVLVDLIGYSGDPKAVDVLQKITTSSSIRIRIFAFGSILMLGGDVTDAALEQVANQPSGRALLWRVLSGRKKLARFPKRYQNQEDLAHAAMAQWLEFPTELGCSPKEIQTLAVLRLEEDHNSVLLYLLKYRHPGLEEGSWVVGVAGTYPENGPVTLMGPSTFSKFQRLDKKSLKEHIFDNVEKGAKYRIIEK